MQIPLVGMLAGIAVILNRNLNREIGKSWLTGFSILKTVMIPYSFVKPAFRFKIVAILRISNVNWISVCIREDTVVSKLAAVILNVRK